MLSLKLDPDLERLLDRDVDDLARYNILRYLHDHPEIQEGVEFFAGELGLRSLGHAREALEALVRAGLVAKVPARADGTFRYRLGDDPASLALVGRLYALSSSSFYGEIVERLAARSLHRARKAYAAARAGRPAK